MKKLLATTGIVLALASASTGADAGWVGRRDTAIGIGLGLSVLGAIIGTQAPRYYGPPPVYYGPPRAYYGPRPYYSPQYYGPPPAYQAPGGPYERTPEDDGQP